MSLLGTDDNLESDIAKVDIVGGPEASNADKPLTEIVSLFERAFEDSKRDHEKVYLYTTGVTKEASVFTGTVVGYDENFVVLVEGDGKLLGAKEQQMVVRRDTIIGMRSASNMMAHT